jgi:hypothetical protein
MSKIILEFDGVEEQDDARTALDGYKWKIAMRQLDQFLRSTTKHGFSLLKPNEKATELECKIAEKFREKIRDILAEHNLKNE